MHPLASRRFQAPADVAVPFRRVDQSGSNGFSLAAKIRSDASQNANRCISCSFLVDLARRAPKRVLTDIASEQRVKTTDSSRICAFCARLAPFVALAHSGRQFSSVASFGPAVHSIPLGSKLRQASTQIQAAQCAFQPNCSAARR